MEIKSRLIPCLNKAKRSLFRRTGQSQIESLQVERKRMVLTFLLSFINHRGLFDGSFLLYSLAILGVPWPYDRVVCA